VRLRVKREFIEADLTDSSQLRKLYTTIISCEQEEFLRTDRDQLLEQHNKVSLLLRDIASRIDDVYSLDVASKKGFPALLHN